MPFPTSLQLPKSVVGVYQTKTGQNYSARYDFPKDASGNQPLMAGVLLSHNNLTNWNYVAKEWKDQSSLEDIPTFSGDGEALYSVFFLNCELYSGDNNKLAVGYGDAEAGSTAGTLSINKAQGSEANPPAIETQLVPIQAGVNEKIGYPFAYNLFNWGGNEGYHGTVKVSILTPLEKSVVVGVFDNKGKLLGFFDEDHKSDIYISVAGERWICSFLKAQNNGNGQFNFTIGDPREDGTMQVREV
jgi:hypothetical protein